MKELFGIGLMVCLAVFAAFPGHVPGEKEPIKPCVTISGTDSQILEKTFQRIRTQDQWVKLWQQHRGKPEGEYDFFYDPLKLPLVDFKRFMVLAILEGSGWNCAGLTAESVIESDDVVTLRYATKPFQTSGPGGGGEKVSVYGFFVVPKSDKPVIFEEKAIVAREGKTDFRMTKEELYTTKWKQRFKVDAVK